MEDTIALSMLKTILNKMEVEKLVIPSLKHGELTEKKIDEFTELMTKAYDYNISVIKDVIERIESKSENEEKQND